MSRRRTLDTGVPPLSPLPERPEPLPRAWKLATALVLAAYLGLALGHLAVTPVAPNSAVNYINAPDEAAHLLYIRSIAVGGRLPHRGDPEFPTYEWHQPPLYYLLAAPLYALGAHAVRLLSVLLGLGTLLILLHAARRLLPTDPAGAVAIVGVAALIPMRQAITGAVGNDALIELFFTLTLALLFECLRTGFNMRRGAFLGLCLAGALLTKATGLLLLPIAAVALILIWRSGDTPQMVAQGAIVAAGVMLSFTGPWYARNMALYHELTPAKAFLHEFEGTKKASDFLEGRGAFTADLVTGDMQRAERLSRFEYLLLVKNWTFRSFWAAYTPPRYAALGIPLFLPAQFYLPYALLVIAGPVGMGLLHRRRKEFSATQRSALALCFLTLGLVFLGFAGFVWVFFQTQGRYLYPALLPISLCLALGFRALVPPARRDAATAGLLALMGLLAVAFLVSAVMPAYGG